MRTLFALLALSLSLSTRLTAETMQIDSECGAVDFPVPSECGLHYTTAESYAACVGLEYLDKGEDSTDGDDIRDKSYRKFFKINTVNLSQRPLTCTIGISAVYSYYTVDTAFAPAVVNDYCSPALSGTVRPLSEFTPMKKVIDGCLNAGSRSFRSTAFQTKGFEFEYNKFWNSKSLNVNLSNRAPIYCPNNSTVQVNCTVGCSEGEVERDNSCKKGCQDANAEFHAEGSGWDSLLSFGEKQQCKLEPKQCTNGLIVPDKNKVSSNGILHNGKCVNECYDPADGLFHADKSNWDVVGGDVPNPKIPGAACNYRTEKKSCDGTEIKVDSTATTGPGFLDNQLQCKSGCDTPEKGLLAFDSTTLISQTPVTIQLNGYSYSCNDDRTAFCSKTGVQYTTRRNSCKEIGACEDGKRHNGESWTQTLCVAKKPVVSKIQCRDGKISITKLPSTGTCSTTGGPIDRTD